MEANTKVGAGRFTLVRPLGRGGMGEVWLAQDERLHEQVALKFLPAEIRSDETALDDLRRETARSHRLTHSNIVRIHDLHEEPGGLAFIAMEYVDGPTLASLRLQQDDRVFGWQFLQPLVQQLCAALQYAHEEKVIHRDLKPANMMLDSRGRLKLADFGIAATVSDSVSRISLRHSTSGTLAYMSPQQLAGKRPQVADDIYALGATLYELLTSKPPFCTGDISHQVLNEAPEPVAERLAALEIQNGIPSDVAALIMACLAKDPAQRPQSAAAVAEWIGLTAANWPSTQGLGAGVFAESKADAEDAAGAKVDVVSSASLRGAKRVILPLAALMVLLLAAPGVWQFAKTSTARKTSPSAAEKKDLGTAKQTLGESIFVSLFDGRDLAGWDADSRFWSIHNGAIHVEFNEAEASSSDIVWTNNAAQDFELRFSCRFVGRVQEFQGNLVVLIRQSDTGAYRIPITATSSHGQIVESGGNYRTLVPPGQRRIIRAGEDRKASSGGEQMTPKDQVRSSFKQNEWNDVVVLAEGQRVVVKINGVVTADLTDADEAGRQKGNGIHLGAWRDYGKSIKGEFKNIMLRPLAATTTIASKTEPLLARAAQEDPQSAKPAALVESGFVSLFNGRDLSAWNGDTKVWSVRDGMIVGQVVSAPAGDHFLLWKGGEVADFELRFSCWVPKDQTFRQGQAGVRFRAQPDSGATMPGYNFDVATLTRYHCELKDLFRSPGNALERGLICPPGKRTIVLPDGAANKFQTIGTLASTPAALEAGFDYGGWNSVRILALRTRIRAWINNQLLIDCTDESGRFRHGLLALKLWFNEGPVATAKFKDIHLKRLEAWDNW